MVEATTAISVLSSTVSAMSKIASLAKQVKDFDTKQTLSEVYDVIFALKVRAGSLEDEVRGLREELRFKSEEFEFRNPYYYERINPTAPLCPKCFSQPKASPMGHRTDVYGFRQCLVCSASFMDSEVE